MHTLLCGCSRWTTDWDAVRLAKHAKAASQWQAHQEVQSRLPGCSGAHPAMTRQPCACASFYQQCAGLPAWALTDSGLSNP